MRQSARRLAELLSFGVAAILLTPMVPAAMVPAAMVPAKALGAPVLPADPSAAAKRLSPPRRTLSVIAGGDILTENAVVTAAAGFAAGTGSRYDFAPVFAPVAPILRSADLAICHAEIPIGRPGQRPGVYGRSPFGGNLLLAPYELAAGLADSGFDRCSTASNHSNDLGAGGIVSTLDAFDDSGITHVGTARNPMEAVDTVFTVNGVRVAHLSTTRYGNTVSPSSAWLLNGPTAASDVAARVASVRTSGAEIVIVSVHLSKEMLPTPIPADRAFVTELTALASVDLVVQHGPHVIQPVEIVNGAIVYWSVGNFTSGMGVPGTGRYADQRTLDGLLAAVRFTEASPGDFDAAVSTVLICSERSSRTVHAPISELATPGQEPRLRTELTACVDRSLPVEPTLT